MNRYMILAGMIAAVSTPLGVHIGYLMACNMWFFFIIEIGFLTILHLIAPLIWVRAQTIDIRDTNPIKDSDC